MKNRILKALASFFFSIWGFFMMVQVNKRSIENKQLPKCVSLWLLLWGFLVGNAIGGLILMFNFVAWAIINVSAILLFFFLDWRYGEAIQAYIPRYKIRQKEESK